jgi:regulator of sirC expression with transglutaminase-like and TPR domain
VNSSVAKRFEQVVLMPDEQINVAEAALLIAAEEYPGLDVDAYLAQLDELASTLKRRLRPDISSADTVLALNRYLFDELGFAPNTDDYYDARNSFLNEVIDRKRGIPITLAIVYMEIGRRVGLPLHGISFPGHFLVKCQLHDGTLVLDPYAKGVSLGLRELQQRVKNLRGAGSEPTKTMLAGMLATASNKEILARMLRNLKGIYMQRKEWLKTLSTTDRIISMMPEVAEEYRDRGMAYLHLECFRAALFDLQAYLKMLPGAGDADVVRQHVVEVQALAAKLN